MENLHMVIPITFDAILWYTHSLKTLMKPLVILNEHIVVYAYVVITEADMLGAVIWKQQLGKQ
jgi:hypothetical protein